MAVLQVTERGRESLIDFLSWIDHNRRMPRRPRIATGGLVYHVLNRRAGRLPLFERSEDYAAFHRILCEAYEETRIRIVAYCLMPTHWHLVLWPRKEGELSEVMRWMTVTHTQRWHAAHQSSGTGPVYQGRFKSFPVQTDEHFLTLVRYVERNPLRAKLISRAEEWRWSSLWQWKHPESRSSPFLSEWPVERPRNWVNRVNKMESTIELEDLRNSVQRGCPFGAPRWQVQMCKRLGLESTLRARGRPKGS